MVEERKEEIFWSKNIPTSQINDDIYKFGPNFIAVSGLNQ